MNKRRSVIITGGTGLIGSQLATKLAGHGHRIFILSRNPGATSEKLIKQVYWDPLKGKIDTDALPPAPYVYHLAGAPIVGKRWTRDYQQLIIKSRVKSAAVLKHFFETKGYRPACYIGASAIGIYGNSGDHVVDEEVQGDPQRFIVRSVMEWEKAHMEISAMDIRTVIIRIGLVLSKQGGLLKEMLLPAKFGIYGYFGDGKQHQSWIHIDDLVRIFMLPLQEAGMQGTFNGVAPRPVNAKTLSHALKNAKGPGLLMPVPTIFLKVILGKAHRILLDSCHASAEKIQDAGMEYSYPSIGPAMQSFF